MVAPRVSMKIHNKAQLVRFCRTTIGFRCLSRADNVGGNTTQLILLNNTSEERNGLTDVTESIDGYNNTIVRFRLQVDEDVLD